MSARSSIRVCVVGSSGRMGRFASELLARTDGFELAGEVKSGEDLAQRLRSMRPLVALDVTRAGLGYEHGRAMLEHGVRPVIGTSGVTLDENRALDAQARELSLGGLVVPNFSVGMWLLQRAAVDAAKHFAKVEIVEMHHSTKKDAPSGTSIDTAERIASARGDRASVPIHSVRMPGLYAHQLVMFGADGEVYTLKHDMHGPQAFAVGILRAIEHASTAIGVGRGIGHAFESA
jgi:4-hydroxy-tetrahydrodipicolinate reductase